MIMYVDCFYMSVMLYMTDRILPTCTLVVLDDFRSLSRRKRPRVLLYIGVRVLLYTRVGLRKAVRTRARCVRSFLAPVRAGTRR